MEQYGRRIRDPVHGFIHLSAKELSLVESAAFRRLRNIKQLGLTYLVYPGAMHTRFEHSLGVTELATRAFEALVAKFKPTLEANFKELSMSLEQAKTLLRVTALLHDVGHLPFSHGGEEVLPVKSDGRRVSHEEVSVKIIRGSDIAKILRRDFYREITHHVSLLLGEKEGIPPGLLILKKLISDQFDADRMDYLIRDSLHCGVGYGNFDYLRLLETLRVKDSEEGGLELSIERGGLHTLEAMILARYWMFTQVYFHKTRRIYDIYLSRYLKSWYSHQYENLLDVLKQDDLTVMNGIVRDASRKSANLDLHHYAGRIMERRHHRVVYETADHATAAEKKVAVNLKEALKEKYPAVDFILDLEARGYIHKFYVKDDEELGEEFPVYDTVSDRYSRISEESRIFERVPKNFHVIRIYADVPKEQLVKFREFASERAKRLGEEI